jgi:hypothetical protein
MLDLRTFLKRLKKSWYNRPISVKVDFKPTELANKEKLRKQLKKVRAYYDKYFLNMVDDEDDEVFEIKHETEKSE